jgi:hypothetical protein
MKTQITYKKFNGEDFILMATFITEFEARQKAGDYRAKYGRARVAKNKSGWGVYCCQ